MTHTGTRPIVGLTGAGLVALLAGTSYAQFDHGRLDVEFGPFTFGITSGSGTIETTAPAIGVYDLLKPESSAPGAALVPAFSVADGVLITAAAEIAAFDSNTNFTFAASSNRNNGFWELYTFEADGIAPDGQPQDNNTNIFDRNISTDHDANFAYFPFADGFIAASAFPGSTVANGPLTTINSTAISLVTEGGFATYDGSFNAIVDLPAGTIEPFIPFDSSAATKLVGRYALVLPDFKNVHREGVLLASSPSGESQIVHPTTAQNDQDSYIAPFVDSLPSTNTLQLWVYDVNSFISGAEPDAVSFVYLPYGTTYTIGQGEAQPLPMGMILGSDKLQSFQGPVSVELTRTDGDNNGVAWTELELRVDGLTPANATLMAFAAGGSNQSQDNLLTFEPNAAGDAWILQLRDGPNMAEDGASPEYHTVQFAVFPDGATVQPASAAQVPGIRTNFEQRTVAGSFTMETLQGGNGRGTATSTDAFPAVLDIQQVAGSPLFSLVADNPGDNVYAIDRILASPLIGVTIPQANELGRFDRDTGQADDPIDGDTRTYKTVVEYAAQNFENRLITESINDGGEFNANFAMVHFPYATGFPQQPEVTYIPSQDSGGPVIPVATTAELGFNTDEGVIFARASHNGQKISLVNIDTAGFEISILWPDSLPDNTNGGRDPVTGLNTDDDRLGWVALPYSTPGLVAGQINADGTVANGTGGFTVTTGSLTVDIINADLQDSGVDKTYANAYNISIPGVNSNTDGVLLLQGIGDPTVSVPSPYPIYANNADGSFDVVVLDVADRDTANDANILDEDADAQLPFMFAFIPYEGVPTLDPDLDENTSLNKLDSDEFCDRLENNDFSADLAAPFGELDFFDKLRYLEIAD